jgi:hypothetical protein
MPTPINIVELEALGDDWCASAEAKFSFADVVAITNPDPILGDKRWAFNRWGRDVRNGVVIGEFRELEFVYPDRPVTRSHFTNYLNRSILNRLANFCRGYKRKNGKEDTQPVRGHENPTRWEDTLREEGPGPDRQVETNQVVQMFSQGIQGVLVDLGFKPGDDVWDQIRELIDEGRSVMQACEVLGLPQLAFTSVIAKIRANTNAGEAEREYDYSGYRDREYGSDEFAVADTG